MKKTVLFNGKETTATYCNVCDGFMVEFDPPLEFDCGAESELENAKEFNELTDELKLDLEQNQ